MKNKRGLLNLVAKASQSVANISTGTNSWMFLFQPKMPKNPKKEGLNQ
ncbi:MAG: cyclic lactone autoinducer peptide [Tissierellia bacterium]|nr:cyclic lactone autoinducer peptide [Tissierellia bacterium]